MSFWKNLRTKGMKFLDVVTEPEPGVITEDMKSVIEQLMKAKAQVDTLEKKLTYMKAKGKLEKKYSVD